MISDHIKSSINRTLILGALFISPIGAPVIGEIILHFAPNTGMDNYFVQCWVVSIWLIFVFVGLFWWIAALLVAFGFVLSALHLLWTTAIAGVKRLLARDRRQQSSS